MVSWVLLTTVLTLPTWSQPSIALQGGRRSSPAVLTRIQIAQLLSCTAEIWTQVCLTSKSSTPNRNATKRIRSPTVVWERTTTDNQWSLDFPFFKFVDKPWSEWRSLNWICLLPNIAHHVTHPASLPYTNPVRTFTFGLMNPNSRQR